MMQVWLIDDLGFYLKKSLLINIEDFDPIKMTKTPLTVGYVKPKLVDEVWIEGATELEIQEWEDSQPSPTPSSKTNEELERENKLLKAQVSALSSNQEFLEELIAEIAIKVYS